MVNHPNRSKKDNATPRLWNTAKEGWFSEDHTFKTFPIYGKAENGGSPYIGECEKVEDAELIVRAVNAHEDLMEALMLAEEYIRTKTQGEGGKVHVTLKEALAKASV